MTSFRLIHYPQLDSTNVEAKRMIDNGSAKHGTVITTDNQTHGRGQFGRTWYSEQSQNALLSIILRPTTLAISSQYLLNLMVSLGVADALADYDVDASVKWPNDIYVSDKKICGILIQNYIRGSNIDYTIIGIGLNTNQLSWDPSIPNPTSLAKEKGRDYDNREVRDLIIKSVLKRYDTLFSEKEKLIEAYHELLYRKDMASLFEIKDEKSTGVIKGVDNLGRLQVQFGEELLSYQHGEIKMVI